MLLPHPQTDKDPHQRALNQTPSLRRNLTEMVQAHGSDTVQAIRVQALLADNLMAQSGLQGTCQHHVQELRREAMSLIEESAVKADQLHSGNFDIIADVQSVGCSKAVRIHTECSGPLSLM